LRLQVPPTPRPIETATPSITSCKLQHIHAGAILGISVIRHTRAPPGPVASLPHLLAVRTPRPLVLLPTRRRHIHQHRIIPAAPETVCAPARGHPRPRHSARRPARSTCCITSTPSAHSLLLREADLVVAAAALQTGLPGHHFSPIIRSAQSHPFSTESSVQPC
jgi:hypothetical protein